MDKLAIDGGNPIRTKPFPARHLLGEEEKAAVVKLFDEAINSGNAFGYNGTAEQQYEKDFVEFMGGGFADGVNSGTNAVFCAIGALQIDVFSEIIVSPITDSGGIMPIVMAGCVPVVADADTRSYNTCAEEIERMVSERTRAIIVAHIAGEPVDMDPIIALARKHNLYVIEDCAQAHGAKYKGKLVGSLGDIAAFSTMSGKHHCTGAQGGVVYTRNESLFWRAKRFADRGKPFNIPNAPANGNVVAGLNCNLNDLAAVIGSVQIKKLPSIIERRRKVGEAVKNGLEGSKVVSVGWQPPQSECSYWFLRLKLNLDALKVDKAVFCNALNAEGVRVWPDYFNIPCTSPWFSNKSVFGKTGFPWNCSDYKGSRTPVFKIDNAKRAIRDHFNIFISEAFGQEEVDDILAAIKKVERAYTK